MVKNYFVYILSNRKNGTLYVGITNDLYRRALEHKEGRGSKFTSKYDLKSLVYYEIFSDPENAIKREKQIKGGSRLKKLKLMEGRNQAGKDLFGEL